MYIDSILHDNILFDKYFDDNIKLKDKCRKHNGTIYDTKPNHSSHKYRPTKIDRGRYYKNK